MTFAPVTTLHDRILLQSFEESLGYWCNLKSRLKAHTQNETPLTNNDKSLVTDVVEFVHRDLCNHFKAQEQRVKNLMSSGQLVHYMHARYAIVALIDDELLQPGDSIWTLQEQWLTLLLEKSLFQTSIAGDKIISRIDELLLREASADHISSQHQQLAYIYLSILWQGFRGVLRLDEDNKRLNELKNKLIELCDVSPIRLDAEPLLPQPYAKASGNQNKQSKAEDNSRLAPIARWHRIVLLAFVVFMVLSTAVWFGLTKSLNELLNDYTFNHSRNYQQQSSDSNKNTNKSASTQGNSSASASRNTQIGGNS